MIDVSNCYIFIRHVPLTIPVSNYFEIERIVTISNKREWGVDYEF